LRRRDTVSVPVISARNKEESNKVKIMFKYGDDLRKDSLVL